MTAAKKTGAPDRRAEPPFIRRLLIVIALAFMALFLVMPLVSVFAGALKQGFGFYFQTIRDPMTLSAIKLTLIAAGISVPLNCIFGVAAAWAIAKFDFRGKNILLTLIDLPFSISPVISGMIYVLVFRRARLVRLVVFRPRYKNYFRRSGNRSRDDFCHVSVCRARIDSAHAGAGADGRRSRAGFGRERLADFLACDNSEHQMGIDLRRDFVQRARNG
jgi:hypothetical protein